LQIVLMISYEITIYQRLEVYQFRSLSV